MSSEKNLLKRLLADESGQATTEYVMLLVIVATAIVSLGAIFRQKMLALVQGPLSNSINDRFFNEGRIHQFRLRP